MAPDIHVDTDIPAGNAVVERVDGHDVYLRPDLRDTTQPWFYWHVRLRGPGGTAVALHLTRDTTVTGAGPAASEDGGWSWRWLGPAATPTGPFHAVLPEPPADLRVSFAMPYTERNLRRYLDEGAGRAWLRTGELCRSRGGRTVERIDTGAADRADAARVLVTARHHCCEMIASYALEGLLDACRPGTPVGDAFADRIALTAIPFVDKDGVEAGDQGKARDPHDHNRDYAENGIYPETHAIRALPDAWGNRLDVHIDLHCPHVCGAYNEAIYLVGSRLPRVWEQQQRFGLILERTCAGPLPYRAADNLPFGQGWNKDANYDGVTSVSWSGQRARTGLAATIEIPYALVHDVPVTQENARAFGHDLAAALAAYL